MTAVQVEEVVKAPRPVSVARIGLLLATAATIAWCLLQRWQDVVLEAPDGMRFYSPTGVDLMLETSFPVVGGFFRLALIAIAVTGVFLILSAVLEMLRWTAMLRIVASVSLATALLSLSLVVCELPALAQSEQAYWKKLKPAPSSLEEGRRAPRNVPIDLAILRFAGITGDDGLRVAYYARIRFREVFWITRSVLFFLVLPVTLLQVAYSGKQSSAR